MAKNVAEILGANTGEDVREEQPQTGKDTFIDNTEGATKDESGTQDAVKDGDTPTSSKEPDKGDIGQDQPKDNKDTGSEKTDYLKWFNETFQTEYKDVNDIKGVFGKLKEYEGKIKEYEPYRTQVETLQKKIAETEKQLNPLSWFKDENEFRAQQLKIKYPDKNPDVLQKIVGTDLKQVDDLEVLVLQEMADNPGLDRQTVEAVIKDHYGLDLDAPGEDADESERAAYNKKVSLAKAKMTIDANKARRALGEIANVELPGIPTQEEIEKAEKERQDALKEKWMPQIEKLTEPTTLDIKDNDGNVLLSFEIPESTTKELKTFMENLTIGGGIDPSEEMIGFVVSQREKELVHKHLPEILKAYGNQVKSEVLKQVDEENNNTKPPNSKEAPESGGAEPSGIDMFVDSHRGARPKILG